MTAARMGEKIGAEVVGRICSESDGHRNRAGTDSQRQGQRIKSAARMSWRLTFFLNGGAAVHFLFAFQHGPAVGNDN